ncbi:mechanosensitive ion channel family protein [Aquimarina rhabdastrellae]
MQVKEKVKEVITEDIWGNIQYVLDYKILNIGSDKNPVILTVGLLIAFIVVFFLTSRVLRFLRRIISSKFENSDKATFESIFSFLKYFVYIIVFFIALDTVGFDITAIFATSAALLVGVGLALQTFFQDILSGIFIILDKTVYVGDVIELDGKVGRVEEIKLRSTRAVTIENKVMIIPNHKYLTSSLYNWTQNGKNTRESITIGVAYGSDTQLVKELLLQAALQNKYVLKKPEPLVLFNDFADSALIFQLVFTVNDSFNAIIPKSEIRFEIDRLFKERDIKIPFPQREVTVINS